MRIPETLKSTLAHPFLFKVFNRLIGTKRSTTVFVETYVRPKPQMRILDVGCGDGRLAAWLEGTHYTGIDISAPYIESARKAFPWAHFILGDICTGAISASSADLAIIGGVLHHLSDDQCRVLLKNLADILRPEGTLVVLEPAFVEKQSPVAHWLMKNDRGDHVRQAAEYTALLAADFTITESVVSHDMLNIPYTHAIYRAQPKPHASF